MPLELFALPGLVAFIIGFYLNYKKGSRRRD